MSTQKQPSSRYKCALNLSSMVAEAATPADAQVAFQCRECSLSREACGGPCGGPVEVRANRRKRREARAMRAEVPNDDLEAAQWALEELGKCARRIQPKIGRAIVRAAWQEISTARMAGCDWRHIAYALRECGYKVGVVAIQEFFTETPGKVRS